MEPLKIAEGLFRHYESIGPIRHYYGLLALYALAQTATETEDAALIEKARTMLLAYPDGVEHPNYNFENYRVGGNGKAWLLYQGLCEEHRELVREYAEKTLHAKADQDGILCSPKSEVEKTWIDVVACVTPFMLFAGLALQNETYIDFAARQCFLMYERFLDRENGLLHQAKGFLEDPEAISEDHWGRGNGWGYLGLATLVEHLPKGSPHRKTAERYYKDLSAALLRCRNHKGVWRQELPCDFAWDESSGTGLILYGLGVGLRLGLLERETAWEPFRQGLDAVCKFFINPDYSTNMCCNSCLCPTRGARRGSVQAYLTDVYPQTDNPHSFGALMLAMLEARRNGIKELGGEA